MTKTKHSQPLKGAMYYDRDTAKSEPVVEEEGGSTRINMRVSAKTLAFLRAEAEESGTSVSQLCSLAVYDWVQSRRRAAESTDAVKDAIARAAFEMQGGVSPKYHQK
jgi:hypothetical protein